VWTRLGSPPGSVATYASNVPLRSKPTLETAYLSFLQSLPLIPYSAATSTFPSVFLSVQVNSCSAN
jgi:hypothetical protein